MDESNGLALGHGHGIGGEWRESSEPKRVSLSDRWLSALGEEGNGHSVRAPVGCVHANARVCVS